MLTPTFTPLRIEGSGDVYTYVGTVTYANGETWQMLVIIELRGGKIARTTSWYAAPFEAPGLAGAVRGAFPGGGRLGCAGGSARR